MRKEVIKICRNLRHKISRQNIIDFVGGHPRLVMVLTSVGLSITFASVGRFFVHEAIAITGSSTLSQFPNLDNNIANEHFTNIDSDNVSGGEYNHEVVSTGQGEEESNLARDSVIKFDDSAIFSIDKRLSDGACIGIVSTDNGRLAFDDSAILTIEKDSDATVGKIVATDDSGLLDTRSNTEVLSIERRATDGACIGIVSVKETGVEAQADITVQNGDKLDLLAAFHDKRADIATDQHTGSEVSNPPEDELGKDNKSAIINDKNAEDGEQ